MPNKKEIEVKIDGSYLDRYSFEGNINKLINKLVEIRQDATNQGYEDIRIVLEHHSWSDDDDYGIYGTRLETDLEFNKRIRTEKKKRESNLKRKLTLKEKRRKKYVQLKKEFDGSE